MAKLSDLVRFRSDLYYNGAVQADWFYHADMRQSPVENFVFHGREYFGVTTEDIVYKSHDLVDTAAFTERIARKLYQDDDSNPLVMAIAGYGAGKSHLAVTIGTLFSMEPGTERLQETIIQNLTRASKKVGQNIREMSTKPNLVIVLNGMQDFNLSYQILASARRSLQLHGVDDDFLRSITRSYEVARHFVERTFDSFKAQFVESASRHGYEATDLKQKLLAQLDSDTTTFEVINDVYKELNGNYIRWDEGVSAGDVLLKIREAVCGDRGYFNKILILFDEFGRYIEFASEYPSRAGESAIQQIFEAVQNSEREIVFVGFIQADLKTYLARVKQSSNIQRYVGRFESSDKVHLSSNLETIFANLLEKSDRSLFERLVTQSFDKPGEREGWDLFHRDLIGWMPGSCGGVWTDRALFRKVILEGTYPLHPLTTWILSNLSNWLQQRSSLSFVGAAYEKYSALSVQELGSLPYIHATEIITTDFFQELLLAEEEGRQQSEYCIQYNSLLRKHKDKLSEDQILVLASILVLKIGRLRTKTIDEVLRAISYASGIDVHVASNVTKVLEDDFGIISFDEASGTFDFIEDAVGANDFKRYINKKRSTTRVDVNVLFSTQPFKEIVGMNEIDTPFSLKNGITTNEWQCTQEVIGIDLFNVRYVEHLKREFSLATTVDKPKGRVVWLYMNAEHSPNSVDEVIKLYTAEELYNLPLVLLLLDDRSRDLYSTIVDYQILQSFSEEDKLRYGRFIADFTEKTVSTLADSFRSLQTRREHISRNGLSILEKRLPAFCDEMFQNLYTQVIPFPFEGFKNKNTASSKKILSTIARSLLSNLISYQWLQAQGKDLRNRVDVIFLGDSPHCWGVLSQQGDSIRVTNPVNPSVRVLFEEINDQVEKAKEVAFEQLVQKYLLPPYGLNDVSVALLLAAYVAYRGQEVRVVLKESHGITRIKMSDWANLVFLDKGIDYSVINRAMLIKVEDDGQNDKVISICNRIERNNDVDMCPSLQKDLEETLGLFDVPESLEDKVKAARMMLDDGIRLHNLIKEFIATRSYKLEQGITKPDFEILTEIITSCEERHGYINDSQRYVYSQGHLNAFDTLCSKARDFIEVNFEQWIVRQKCDSIMHLSGFENWLKRIVAAMKKLEYPDFARLTQNRLTQVIDNLETVKALQTMKDTVQKFLSTCRPDTYTSYDRLMEWKKEADFILEFIGNAPNIDAGMKKEYVVQVEQRRHQIDSAIQKLNDQITRVFDKADELSTVSDCRSLLDDISYLLQKNLRPVDRNSIQVIGDLVQDFLLELNAMETDSNDDPSQIKSYLDGLQNKWKSKTSEVCFDDVINDVWVRKESQFNELETKWVSRFLSNTDVMQWDRSTCSRWFRDTELVPAFVSKANLERYQTVSQTVRERFNEFQIEAVVDLFDSLSEELKIECLKRLQQVAEMITSK